MVFSNFAGGPAASVEPLTLQAVCADGLKTSDEMSPDPKALQPVLLTLTENGNTVGVLARARASLSNFSLVV